MSDYKPITGELRKYATVSWDPWPDARDRLYQMCDRIDAIHAGLERENAELKAKLDRVRGKQEEHQHSIGEATVTITPTLDQPMDRAQTVTYVPETRLLEAMDEAREAGRRAVMAERVAADRKGLCDSLRETNDDLRRIIDEMKDTERLADENAKLREELAKWEQLAAGIDLPEYPVTQFEPKDLERENAKLREQGARLFDKTLELGTENARLRDELDSVGTAAYLYGRGDINDENAKLRELLDYMTPIAWYAASERERDRMRELGIEVES